MSRLKHGFQPRYVIMVIMVEYIPRFHFVYKLQCVQGFLKGKKKCTRSFMVLNWLKFLKISLFLFITETRFDSEPICYFCACSLCATCAHEHFTVIFYPAMNNLVNWSISVVVLLAYPLNKCITKSSR